MSDRTVTLIVVIAFLIAISLMVLTFLELFCA